MSWPRYKFCNRPRFRAFALALRGGPSYNASFVSRVRPSWGMPERALYELKLRDGNAQDETKSSCKKALYRSGDRQAVIPASGAVAKQHGIDQTVLRKFIR